MAHAVEDKIERLHFCLKQFESRRSHLLHSKEGSDILKQLQQQDMDKVNAMLFVLLRDEITELPQIWDIISSSHLTKEQKNCILIDLIVYGHENEIEKTDNKDFIQLVASVVDVCENNTWIFEHENAVRKLIVAIFQGKHLGDCLLSILHVSSTGNLK